MATEFRFPDLGEGIAEGEVKKWLVKVGDTVTKDQSIAEVETDKAVVEIPSPVAGKVLRLDHQEGELVKVGEVLAVIGEEGDVAPTNVPPPMTEEERPASVSVVGELPREEVVVTSVTQKRTSRDVSAMPAVRKAARDRGADITAVTPSGPSGQVLESDLGAKRSPRTVPKFDIYGYVDRVPIRGIRRTTAKRMLESQQRTAAVTSMEQADVTRLVGMRERLKAPMKEQKGVNLTYMPFIVTAIVRALKLHPLLNSMIDDEREELIIKKYYNIGVAVAIDEGLMVPVIKAADQKSLWELAEEIASLAKTAQERKIDLADLKGGTFSITNYGVFGGTYGTPIINYPETAILGIGRIMDAPLVVDGTIKARKVLPLSLTFDHRAYDGAVAAKFLRDLVRLLENPEELLLNMDG
ncbi:MAG TPA: dihydrolipoamide acetyltransferase family protein [Methanomassiliicoccales archaeon]|nr:2-oxo acid dehydrogenase subunit E2 [Methanomassiliicoccales archaeon]HNX47647.1 dihydrolipoamide acetyltransferase family protein [Methanomassiliicoccales archaeon]HPR97924.1 dihydrolipoamide acetyltransferase family protein [Methanomassiliicoccales archaeon]